MNEQNLESIATSYHLDKQKEDKFIEDISQYYFCDWLNEFFPNDLYVCELGYGEGITSDRLSKKFVNYDVVEGSATLCKQAKRKLRSVKVIHSLFENYRPLRNYDLILALHVLEHVDNPTEILAKLKEWLNPGGRVVIVVPNKNSLHRVFAHGMKLISELDELSPRDIEVGHQRVYGFEELREQVTNVGLQVDDEFGFFLKTLPNYMMLEHDPKLILELNKISNKIPPNLLANICLVCSLR